MTQKIKVLLSCALLALGAAAHAQETTGQSGTADQIREQLSLGSTDGEIPLGQPYPAEVLGEWELRCIRTEAEEDPCQMYQLMDDGEGAPVAEFSLFRLPEGGRAIAGATVVVPLETSLTNQRAVSVAGAEARRYPFAFCASLGCYARVGLTAEDINAFRAGNIATITIVPAAAPDQRVELEMSLSGFTASFDKVSVIEQ